MAEELPGVADEVGTGYEVADLTLELVLVVDFEQVGQHLVDHLGVLDLEFVYVQRDGAFHEVE